MNDVRVAVSECAGNLASRKFGVEENELRQSDRG